jgi:hypothetical protein
VEAEKDGKLLDAIAIHMHVPLASGSSFLRQIDLSRNELTDRTCTTSLATVLRAPAAGAVEDVVLEENFITEAGLSAVLRAVAESVGHIKGGNAETLTVNAAKNFIAIAKVDLPGGEFPESDGFFLEGKLAGPGGKRAVRVDVRDQPWGKGFDEEYKAALAKHASLQKAYEVAVSTPHQWVCSLTPGAVATHVAAPAGLLLCDGNAMDPEVREKIVQEHGPVSFLKLYF